MKNVELLISLLIKLGLIDKTYYGSITMKFQNGKMVNCAKKSLGEIDLGDGVMVNCIKEESVKI